MIYFGVFFFLFYPIINCNKNVLSIHWPRTLLIRFWTSHNHLKIELAKIDMLHCDCLTGFPQPWMYPEVQFNSAQKKLFEKLNWIQGLMSTLHLSF